MRAIVLAGGKGTRLAPYTRILPKPLMPIGDMPILEVLLRQMKRAGVDDVVLTVGHLAQLLQAFFLDGGRSGACTSATATRTSRWAPPARSPLIDGLDEAFLVTNGDVLTTLDIAELVRYHRAHGGLATIAIHRRQVKIDLGVIQWNGGTRSATTSRSRSTTTRSAWGCTCSSRACWTTSRTTSTWTSPTWCCKLIAAGEKVVGYPFEGYWQDLGRPDDYERPTANSPRCGRSSCRRMS